MKGTEGMGRGEGRRGREEVGEEREKSVHISELPSFHWLEACASAPKLAFLVAGQPVLSS